MKKKKNKVDISNIYPIKPAKEMSKREFSRWWAFMESLKIIFDHADKLGLETEDINLNTKKILDEYIDPIAGDIENDLTKFLEGTNEENTRFVIAE